MKIYFAGAIRSGRRKVEDYQKIVNKLECHGEVLTKHIADANIGVKGEQDLTLKQIYDRDVEWLKESDIVIAEVSIPSLGIGYEIGIAESLGKKIICLYDENADVALSAMIGGNDNLNIYRYKSIEDVLDIIDEEFHIV